MSKSGEVTRVDSQGIPKTMKRFQFIGDSATQFALNSMSGLVSMIAYFYTDKVGIAAAAAGTVLFVSKIIDAFTDLVMGRIVDKTNTKYGKARPWLLWMSIPACLSIILLFCVPYNAGNAVKNIYALLTNILLSAVVYTAIAIPYGCLMALVTKSIEERTKMGILRAIAGYVSGIVIAIGLIPITNALGGDQKAWIFVAVVFGIVSAGCLLWTFAVSKEIYVEQKEDANDKEHFTEAIKILFQNKYWVIMLFVMLFVNMIYSLSGATAVYYAKYILRDENLVALLGGVGLITAAVSFAVTHPMVKRFGPAKTVRIAMFIGIVATIVRIFAPYNLLITIIFGSLVNFSTIPLMAVGGVLVNNTIEYNEWRFGKRLVGMSNSAISFGAKIGSGLGSAMIGWILALGHYDGMLEVQPASALKSIIVVNIWLPGVLLLAILLLLLNYNLDDKYPAIIKELEKRRKDKAQTLHAIN